MIPHLAWHASCSNIDALWVDEKDGNGTHLCKSLHIESQADLVRANNLARLVGRMLIFHPLLVRILPAFDIQLLLQR